MVAWQIRQEPGPRAVRSAGRYGLAPTKLVGTLDAATEKQALRLFIEGRYRPGHAQYAGHRLEWQSDRAWGNRWNPDDGHNHPGDRRRWRAVVSLANGRNEHDVVFLAWRATS